MIPEFFIKDYRDLKADGASGEAALRRHERVGKHVCRCKQIDQCWCCYVAHRLAEERRNPEKT
jgi:hypothetical protein